MYAERNPPEIPPCTEGIAATNWEPCRIELQKENEDAARIYQIVRGQVLTVGDQVIDLNHLAVWAAIDGYGIKNRTRVFEQIIQTFHHFLKESGDKCA